MENKTNPTTTSFRQSLNLIQAGTPTDNADFVWVTTDAVSLEPILELKESAQKRYNHLNWKFTPAWSLSKQGSDLKGHESYLSGGYFDFKKV